MGLIQCKDCGKEVSTNAKSCPNCGYPLKKGIGCLGYVGLMIIAFCVYFVYLVITLDLTPHSESENTIKKQKMQEIGKEAFLDCIGKCFYRMESTFRGNCEMCESYNTSESYETCVKRTNCTQALYGYCEKECLQ